jgi:MFS family permease
MLAGAGILAIGMLVGPIANGLASLMPLWFVLGLGYSLAQTPTGRLLRRSAHAEDRPALFAAQFALSHACWLVTYPLAGRLGAVAGLDATFVVMAVLACVSLVAATRLWPAVDPEIIPHAHSTLEAGDPHLSAAPLDAKGRHAHAFIIDETHQDWPQPACRVRAGRRA